MRRRHWKRPTFAVALPAAVLLAWWITRAHALYAAVTLPGDATLLVATLDPLADDDPPALWLVAASRTDWQDGRRLIAGAIYTADGNPSSARRQEDFLFDNATQPGSHFYDFTRLGVKPHRAEVVADDLRQLMLTGPASRTFDRGGLLVGRRDGLKVISLPLVPHVLVPSLLPLVILLALTIRRRRQLPADGCPRCGYDLRGTRAAAIGRCPECGAAVVAASGAA